MKNSTRNFILIGCSGVGLVVFLAIGGVLWLIFSAAESINNNMTGGYKISGGKVSFYGGLSGFGASQSREITEADAATFEIISIAADEGQDKNSIFRNGKFWAARQSPK